jgi:EAL domain-containing protein (putative c-di-GMP-specific phosphodiesterase class I)
VSPLPFIAVNVSARQLEHPGLIERVVERVEAAAVPRGSLKVEITESQALDHALVGAAIELCHRTASAWRWTISAPATRTCRRCTRSPSTR